MGLGGNENTQNTNQPATAPTIQTGGSNLNDIKKLLSKNDFNSLLKADNLLNKLKKNYHIGGSNIQSGGGNIKNEYVINSGYWNKMAYYNADSKTTNKLQSIENFIDNYKNKNKYIKKL